MEVWFVVLCMLEVKLIVESCLGGLSCLSSRKGPGCRCKGVMHCIAFHSLSLVSIAGIGHTWEKVV